MADILDVHGAVIDPIWAAEFRGFFLGEGNIEIGQYRRLTLKTHQVGLRPRARITQRADNRAVLEAIQARLGGHVTGHRGYFLASGGNGKSYMNRPQLVWQTISTDGVARVIALMRGGLLPHTKLRELDIVEKYLLLRTSPGRKLTESVRAQMWALKAELMSIRKYVE